MKKEDNSKYGAFIENCKSFKIKKTEFIFKPEESIDFHQK